MNRVAWVMAAWVVAAAFGLGARAAEEAGKLRDGDFVHIIGDSITEQKDYSVNMETYFLACQPAMNLRAMQWGWGGETASGFNGRLSDVLPFKPAVVTTCYGMNDGGYAPLSPQREKQYRDNQREIVRKFKKAGVRLIVVGSPGSVDFDTFRNDPKMAEMYNKTLSQLRDIARQVAEEEGVAFANVHDPMIEATKKGKDKYGKSYHVPGADGFHPGRSGQLVMAYAFLRGLGVDGNIGTITLDVTNGKSEASEGHKVLSATSNSMEIESTKYPFCFYGEPSSPNATTGIIEFIPFNHELNRLTLKVLGVKGKGKVTWGNASKEFTGEELQAGINLAAEFLENPFSEPFKRVMDGVRNKQNYETPVTKQALRGLDLVRKTLTEEEEAVDRLIAAFVKKERALGDDVAKLVTPVRHRISVEVVK